MEWDTAAGHAVAQYAGARIYEYESGKTLRYNKENLLNPWFIVEGSKDSRVQGFEGSRIRGFKDSRVKTAKPEEASNK